MKISIITLFPEVFDPILNSSILKRAQKKDKVKFEFINLRDFGEGKHQIVDGKPYGGGVGMLFRADILAKALQWTIDNGQLTKKKISNVKSQMSNVILTSASGKPYKQKDAQRLSKLDHLVIVCGHYEGVDQRFIDKYVDEEISIGDYILTGGEIPAMIIADSVVRLIPGVLKKPEATLNESYQSFSPAGAHSSQTKQKKVQLLEHPQYTKPNEFEGLKVPEILLSGNHKKIDEWRKEQSIRKTKKIRPDLLSDD